MPATGADRTCRMSLTTPLTPRGFPPTVGGMERHRVVIVGGGFGGLACARALADARVDVVLVDRRNHHLFQPLLYQVATAGLNPSDIAYPIRSVLRKQANARVMLGEVVGIDPTAKVVTLADGEAVTADTIVVAAGARHAYFGNDEWETHAPGLKSVEDALEIRRRILLAFELAERSDDPDEIARLLTFVVVGAGPTGVEMAGAISEIALTTLRRDFRGIDPATTRVVLVEGSDRVLGSYSSSLSDKAKDQLEGLGVEVRLGSIVTVVDERGVSIGDERLDAGTIVWGAGVAASPLGEMLGAPLDRSGRVLVQADLSIDGHPDVFVIGDLAAVADCDGFVPGVSPAAIQGGEHVAAILTTGERSPFRYKDKGSMATIGRRSAVAEVGRLKLSGVPAWIAWWAVHIAFLIGFRSRALVMFSWGWSYLTFQRGARLITRAWRPGGGVD